MSQAMQCTCYMADSCSWSGDQTVGYLIPCYCFWIIKYLFSKISHFRFAGVQEIPFPLHFQKREFESYTINHITCLIEGESKPRFHRFHYLTISLFKSLLVVVVLVAAAIDVLCGEFPIPYWKLDWLAHIWTFRCSPRTRTKGFLNFEGDAMKLE